MSKPISTLNGILLRVMMLVSLYNNYVLRLMDKILHDPKDPKLWELGYIPYYGSCRILSINRKSLDSPRIVAVFIKSQRFLFVSFKAM